MKVELTTAEISFLIDLMSVYSKTHPYNIKDASLLGGLTLKLLRVESPQTPILNGGVGSK